MRGFCQPSGGTRRRQIRKTESVRRLIRKLYKAYQLKCDRGFFKMKVKCLGGLPLSTLDASTVHVILLTSSPKQFGSGSSRLFRSPRSSQHQTSIGAVLMSA